MLPFIILVSFASSCFYSFTYRHMTVPFTCQMQTRDPSNPSVQWQIPHQVQQVITRFNNNLEIILPVTSSWISLIIFSHHRERILVWIQDSRSDMQIRGEFWWESLLFSIQRCKLCIKKKKNHFVGLHYSFTMTNNMYSIMGAVEVNNRCYAVIKIQNSYVSV